MEDQTTTERQDELEGDQQARLETLLDVVTALAELDFSKRADIRGDGSFVDGMAYGLNVLAEELRASVISRDYYDGIIRSMAEGLLVVDPDDVITDVNPALSELLGHSHPNLVGRSWATICAHPRAELRLEPSSASGDGARRRVETEMLRADGSRVEVVLSGSVLRGRNDADHWMYVVGDITAQRELARNLAQARDAAVHSAQVTASFLANMSHEIRTPLNGVIGMAWLLLEDGASSKRIDPATLAKIETIHDSATLLLDIVNDILDLSKLESGSAELHLEEFGPAVMVEDLLHVYAVRAEHKGIEIVSLISPVLPPRVRGDVGGIRQVLGNLVSNAVKFTERGEVRVEVRPIERGSDQVEWIRFEVNDTGIGIAEHLQDAIFEPFQQAETTTARRYGGTGLGLAISRRLIELMGGRIGCTSRLGQGATFWMEVPFESARSYEGAWKDLLAECTLLVVDDNARRRHALSRSIEAWGGTTLTASNTEEATLALRSADRRPTLAIVDWSLERGGMAQLDALAEAAGAPLPMVLAVSLSSSPPMDQLRAKGVIQCLPKPLKHGRLRRLLADQCGEGLDLPSHQSSTAIRRLSSEQPLLVVEDNPTNQTVILGQLERLGLSATLVDNGEDAVEAVAKQAFSLVLMDLYMPRMDGYEATSRIRRLEHGADVPLVAVTANATEQVRKRCFSVGMDDFLSKPLRIDQLARTLSRWLKEAVDIGELEESETGEEAPSPPRTPESTESSSSQPTRETSPAPENGPRPLFTPGTRVLIVDDNAINRRVLMGLFRRLGVDADQADGGESAIASALARRYDAVLMDVEMGDLDGPAATRRIREQEHGHRTPIIAVTGHQSVQERERCMAADMDDFLSKPVRMQQLVPRLLLWLGPGFVLSDAPRSESLLDRRSPSWEPPDEAPVPIPDIVELFVSAGRERLDRLRHSVEQTPADDDSGVLVRQSVFALVHWAANLGLHRLAGIAAAVEHCALAERRVLLNVLDQEISVLTH